MGEKGGERNGIGLKDLIQTTRDNPPSREINMRLNKADPVVTVDPLVYILPQILPCT